MNKRENEEEKNTGVSLKTWREWLLYSHLQPNEFSNHHFSFL